MLKLTLKPGDYLDIGENVKAVFSGGSANNIHLLVDAQREMNIARSREAQKEIVSILHREQMAGCSGMRKRHAGRCEKSSRNMHERV